MDKLIQPSDWDAISARQPATGEPEVSTTETSAPECIGLLSTSIALSRAVSNEPIRSEASIGEFPCDGSASATNISLIRQQRARNRRMHNLKTLMALRVRGGQPNGLDLRLQTSSPGHLIAWTVLDESLWRLAGTKNVRRPYVSVPALGLIRRDTLLRTARLTQRAGVSLHTDHNLHAIGWLGSNAVAIAQVHDWTLIAEAMPIARCWRLPGITPLRTHACTGDAGPPATSPGSHPLAWTVILGGRKQRSSNSSSHE